MRRPLFLVAEHAPGAGPQPGLAATASFAALFGLGYIIGIRYASIIASGSVLAMMVMVPAVYLFGKNIDSFAFAGNRYTIATMSATAIFGAFVKPIGIGAIAVSGIIGINPDERVSKQNVLGGAWRVCLGPRRWPVPSRGR